MVIGGVYLLKLIFLRILLTLRQTEVKKGKPGKESKVDEAYLNVTIYLHTKD